MLLAPSLVALLVSSSPCSSEARVAAELARLRQVGSSPEGERIEIEEMGDGYLVTLSSATRPQVRRSIPRAGTCEDQVVTIATIIIAWDAELAGTELRLPAGAVITPLPTPRPVAPEASSRRAVDVELGVAFSNALAGRSWAPGALVEGAFGTRGWSGVLGIAASAPRGSVLADGSASWLRASVRLGVSRRLSWSRYGVDLDGMALLALLRVEGHGFAEDHVAHAFDPGLAARVRFGAQLGRVRVFGGVEVDGWPSTHQLLAIQEGATSAVEAPRLDVLLSIGVAFNRRTLAPKAVR